MAKRFERALEKATSAQLLEPDWEGILGCVDGLRSGEAPLAPAVLAIRKRFHHDNPHVASYALLVLEAAMKNCGERLHSEVVTKEMMEDLKHLAAEHGVEKLVRDKILYLIACWAQAFRKKPELKVVVDTYNLMKLEGFEFPAVGESEAMFLAESAPEWADGPCCFRCRTDFGLLTRKHHCRNCGQIFCASCSSKVLLLPHIGIEKEVRVCDGCHQKLAPSPEQIAAQRAGVEQTRVNRSSGGSGSGGGGGGGALSEEEKKRRVEEARKREEEELQLALAISQSEAEEAERQKQAQILRIYASRPVDEVQSYKGTQPAQAQPQPPPQPEENPELARYLDRGYWEQKAVKTMAAGNGRKSPAPSAPPPIPSPPPPATNGHAHPAANPGEPRTEAVVALGTGAAESEAATLRFTEDLKAKTEAFVNRIRSNQARGRSIVQDSGINSLFLELTRAHAEVLTRLDGAEDRRSSLESLQDKVSHIGEARDALDALREETRQSRAAAAAEEARRRQAQMTQQLQVMRIQKAEMMERQRLQTLAAMQNHQTELALRRHYQAHGIPQPPVGTPIVYVPDAQGQIVPAFASSATPSPQHSNYSLQQNPPNAQQSNPPPYQDPSQQQQYYSQPPPPSQSQAPQAYGQVPANPNSNPNSVQPQANGQVSTYAPVSQPNTNGTTQSQPQHFQAPPSNVAPNTGYPPPPPTPAANYVNQGPAPAATHYQPQHGAPQPSTTTPTTHYAPQTQPQPQPPSQQPVAVAVAEPPVDNLINFD